ncbi:Ribosomal RNA assembly KRR1 [Apiospora rasikravindrae]|uniref:KRR-R motif-containing protein 1 n=1 Tax=Apiospora rasikravindrae TaxID=990691 RepID=A0ABR1TZN5_9PEZI
MPSTYNVEKPWDTDDIDKWKIEEFKPEHNVAGHFVEESNFSVLFPKYREAYLRESWPMITRALEKRGIACELNLVDGSMKVATTRKTYDPAAILSARDLIRYGYIWNTSTYSGLLTFVLQTSGKIRSCPESNRKESWDRFLPNYKARSLSSRRTPYKVTDKTKKNYTPFPPAQEQSKVDKQLEAGEYHIGREAQKRIAQEGRMEKQKAKQEEKKRERERDFVPPEEGGEKKKKKRKVRAEDGE